jgi:putative NADPH-quinone reductase
MARQAAEHPQVSFVDLYQEYPRFEIDVDLEQKRLLEHDIILFQHPLFWYSTPSIIKEWTDLVLEHGFAFGQGGDHLKGKIMMNAFTAAGPEDAYTTQGYQHYPLRIFLTPWEQTARLCHMQYAAPYVLYSAITAKEDKEIAQHIQGHAKLLDAICNDHYQFEQAIQMDIISASTIDSFIETSS